MYVCMYVWYIVHVRPSQCAYVCKIHVSERLKVDEYKYDVVGKSQMKEEKQGTAVEESVRENVVLLKTLKKERHD